MLTDPNIYLTDILAGQKVRVVGPEPDESHTGWKPDTLDLVGMVVGEHPDYPAWITLEHGHVFNVRWIRKRWVERC